MATATASPADRLVTLPPFPRDGVLTLGWGVIDWIENESGLLQPNGPRAGRPFRLTKGQGRFLLWWYALNDDGSWLYDLAARRLAKGSGKSPFAAVCCLAEFCGPVRLKDFDPKAPGGCVGKPVDMPLVHIAATAESQTKNTMRMVRALAPKGSEFCERHQIDPGKSIYYKLPEGELAVITSSFTASEGAEESFVVEDETEHWKPSNGGVDLASTLEDNAAKSGARVMQTNNAWVPGQESVAEATWDAWLLQEEGRTKGEGRILYDARIAPPDTNLADEDSLRAALRFVYDDCDWKRPHVDGEPVQGAEVDVEPQLRRIWSPRAKPSESKRKYLNWPTAAEDAWVAPEEWAALSDATVTVSDGDEIALFFDGSKSRDATALIGCRIDDGHVFTLGVWEPDPSHDTDETVDPADVDRAVIQAFERYSVRAFFGDVREWESFVYTEWPNRYQDALDVWAVPSGRPPRPIAWDMRSHKDEFARAVEACHAEIIDGAFTHDGDSAVARHVSNARRRPYRGMVSIGKESPDSPRKIDAAVCVVGARMVRRLVLGAGKAKKKSGKVWW